MREKEKEEDREDVEEAVHGASFSRLVQRHLENIISQLSDGTHKFCHFSQRLLIGQIAKSASNIITLNKSYLTIFFYTFTMLFYMM